MCLCRVRKLATRALRQFPDFRHQDILRSRREKTLCGVKAAAFVTAFFEHASRRKLSEHIVAVGGDPKLERPDGLFDQRHVVDDHFTR